MDKPLTYYYLATPYTAHPEGTIEAHYQACQQAAFLLRQGIPVFSPIAHSHPIAAIGEIPEQDHDFWLDIDKHFMVCAQAMIWCMLPGHQNSKGMAWERQWFIQSGREIIYMEPWVLPQEISQ